MSVARLTNGPVVVRVRPRTGSWLPWLSLTVAQTALIFLGTLVLWALVPSALGWQTAVVTSGSMEPALPVGSVIVAAPPTDETLRPGAVVLAETPDSPGQLVSHRMVRLDPDGSIVTRGDANPTIDSVPIPTESVHGVVRLVVPVIGGPATWWRAGAYGHVAAAAGFVLTCLVIVIRVGIQQREPRARHRRPSARGPATGTALMVTLAATVALAPADAAFTARTQNPGDLWVTATSFVCARDTFTRTVSGGLGTAEIGGAWSPGLNSGSGTSQSVDGQSAVFGFGSDDEYTSAYLPAPSSRYDVNVLATTAFSDVPNYGGASMYVLGRRTAAGYDYMARVRVYRDGYGNNRIGVAIIRRVNNFDTVIAGEQTLSGYAYNESTPDRLNVRMVVTNVVTNGVAGTSITATVWDTRYAEPATPTVSTSAPDTTASLQGAGSVGIAGYMDGSLGTNYWGYPIGMKIYVDSFQATKGT